MMTKQTDGKAARKKPQYVVGVGTSAGGLDALTKLLERFDEKAVNFSVVVVQHVSPSHKSELTHILSRHCKWPVVTAENEMDVQPRTVYVTPPQKQIWYKNRRLALGDLLPQYSHAPSIDEFLVSLANDEHQHAVGIVLSGTGHDGAKGIRAIKENGGLTIAQAPESAQYADMPQAAIATDAVDMIVPPGEIYEELAYYVHHHRIVKDSLYKEKAVDAIFDLVSRRCGVDFSQYKPSTILRRLEKRIQDVQLKTLTEYYEFVKRNPLELDALFECVLIGVTEFFRDKEAFKRLKPKLETLIRQKAHGEPIRIWCVGCATGEEPYSIAILLHEILGKSLFNYAPQIFATDIDERALNMARKGVYPEATVSKLSPEMIDTYFDRVEEGVEIKKKIKQHVLFSKHDITSDPPFVKLDLIVCRNLLIYFNNNLQKEVLRIFNYGLKDDGLLFLGKSESVSVTKELFARVEGVKLFRKVPGQAPMHLRFSRFRLSSGSRPESKRSRAKAMSLVDIAKETLYYANPHPFVIINEHAEIRETQGSLRLYLEVSQGAMNANVLKMANPELTLEIRSLLAQVKKSGQYVRSSIIKFSLFEKEHYVRLSLTPLIYNSGGLQHYLLRFEAIEPDPNYLQLPEEIFKGDPSDYRIKELEQEAIALREHLQTFTEELESTNEEMQAVNEELQSANEELRSTNEELETSNEELQSANEELHTSNSELRMVNAELVAKEEELKAAQQHSEKNELLYRTIAEHIPNGTIGILNKDFQIEFIAGQGLATFDLEPEKIIGNVLPEMNPSPEEREKLRAAFTRTLEGEACNLSFSYVDHIYSMQTIPFAYPGDPEPKIMYLSQDVTEIKAAEAQLQQSEQRFRNLAENLPALCWMARPDGHIYWYNARWYAYTGTTSEDMEGWGWQSVHDPDILPEVLKNWNESIKTRRPFEMTFPLKGSDGNFRSFLTRVIPLKDADGNVLQWFGTNTDVTEKELASERLEQLVQERTAELNQLNSKLERMNRDLFRSNEDLQQFAHVASHDLKEPVRKILTFADRFQCDPVIDLGQKESFYLQKIISAASRLNSMIEGVLLFSSLASLEQKAESVDLNKVMDQILSDLEILIEQKGAQVKFRKLPAIEGSTVLLYQLFYNLINNSLKFSQPDDPPLIRITVARGTRSQKGSFVFTVSDNGIGFSADQKAAIFKPFYRLNSKDLFDGTGLGLSLCKKIVERHEGTINADGEKGKGAVFTIVLPEKCRKEYI